MADNTVEDEVLDENDSEAEPGEEEEKPDAKEDDEIIPVRRSIINTNLKGATRRVIEKEAKQFQKSSKDFEDEPSDEVLTPGARKLIEAEVERRLSPLAQDIENNLLIRDYLSEHPDNKKLENKAKKYMTAHPTLPVDDIFKILTYGVSSEDKSKAEEKVTRGSMKGGSARPKEESVAATEKDYQEIYKNVKRGETGQALKKLGVSRN